MGLTRLKLKIKKDAQSKAERELQFLIDSGAVHTVVPREVLRAIGVKPFKKASFILANGGEIEREIGTAHFVYKDHEGGAPVVFGEKTDTALLGATTLEAMGLALNPLKRELYPLQMTLMADASMWLPGAAGSPSVRRQM
ncbi:MAG: aspartyl protease family protein [Phycisphaerales bacterium]|nr:aspartyl protease family protein [Phycisphaerales bacterium]